MPVSFKTVILGLFFHQAWWFSAPVLAENNVSEKQTTTAFCQELADKLRTVTFEGCQALELNATPHYQSVEQRPLTYREVLPNVQQPPKGRILFMGGIHGDEYAAISITYLWLHTLLNRADNEKPPIITGCFATYQSRWALP